MANDQPPSRRPDSDPYAHLWSDVQNQLGQCRDLIGQLQDEINLTRADRVKLRELGQHLSTRIERLDRSVHGEEGTYSGLRGEFERERSELRREIASVRSELKAVVADLAEQKAQRREDKARTEGIKTAMRVIGGITGASIVTQLAQLFGLVPQ